MNEQKEMRCPFRKAENGDFALCYGAECMAYCEYDSPLVVYTPKTDLTDVPTTHITMCRMMAPVAPHVSCCV